MAYNSDSFFTKKYIILGFVLTILTNLIYIWNYTYNFNVKFSCSRKENICTLKKTNFYSNNLTIKIPQSSIIKAEPKQSNTNIIIRGKSSASRQTRVANTFNLQVKDESKDFKNIELYKIDNKGQIAAFAIQDLKKRTEQLNSYLRGKDEGYGFHYLNTGANIWENLILLSLLALGIIFAGFPILILLINKGNLKKNDNLSFAKFVFTQNAIDYFSKE